MAESARLSLSTLAFLSLFFLQPNKPMPAITTSPVTIAFIKDGCIFYVTIGIIYAKYPGLVVVVCYLTICKQKAGLHSGFAGTETGLCAFPPAAGWGKRANRTQYDQKFKLQLIHSGSKFALYFL